MIHSYIWSGLIWLIEASLISMNLFNVVFALSGVSFLIFEVIIYCPPLLLLDQLILVWILKSLQMTILTPHTLTTALNAHLITFCRCRLITIHIGKPALPFLNELLISFIWWPRLVAARLIDLFTFLIIIIITTLQYSIIQILLLC